MNLIDCHTHTQFSVDSEADINECVRRAAELGLAAYAITDHCECNAWYPEEHYSAKEKEVLDTFDYANDFEASVSAVTALKEKYAGKLNLICGTELGQILHDKEVAEKVNADKRLDFIIGSNHQIFGEKDFYFLDYEKMSMDDIYALLEQYFKEVTEMCRTGLFDVLGHITYCLRYMKQRSGIEADISRFDDIIAESFRTLAQNGKGIEINTSGLRQGFGATFPDLKYTKMFRELGGEILSVGSDSHTVEDIGADVQAGAEIAKAAGFTHLTYFKERKPVFVKID
ncbi:MAG: histidinol-phosphatase HisJ family protein [Ruminococcus sp.]|uniref:histidinol-phosphatase HisJ family protein n=1 Tax=uncultured Ruminococcus sp. TaxID=165186 RepID=UPI002637CBB3|nr:histidinol-phosphatase HisJ family protein [uncultured Ruminococcus sp.]MCR4863071.1 histidinol-phosphatase HisJ family protein [Ruminococcus sp.]